MQPRQAKRFDILGLHNLIIYDSMKLTTLLTFLPNHEKLETGLHCKLPKFEESRKAFLSSTLISAYFK